MSSCPSNHPSGHCCKTIEPVRIFEMRQFFLNAWFLDSNKSNRTIPTTPDTRKNTDEAIALADPFLNKPRGHDQNARSETRTGADNHYLNISRRSQYPLRPKETQLETSQRDGEIDRIKMKRQPIKQENSTLKPRRRSDYKDTARLYRSS